MLLDTTVLPTAASLRQPVRLREEIVDANREIVIGRQQTGAARDDAVAIGSVSQANAISNLSFKPINRRMA